MTPEKQQKMYGVLTFFVIVLMLAAQFVLQYTLKEASEQLVSVSSSLATDKKNRDTQRGLNERLKAFELSAAGQNGGDRQFPLTASDLFVALDRVLRDYAIEFTNSSPNSQVQPGGNFVLTISFSGPYYNVMKALAAIRESEYIMRISDLRLNAEGNGTVRGTMNIVSTARS
ncbi:MAG: hypothetical protein LBQ36_03570 [Synergistaceae bacterium]|jgi:hypothetical protein|nr:hypothetical protein [Synergistaceae bacterium]